MKRTTNQRIELAQQLLFTAATELKALKYERVDDDEIAIATCASEHRIDGIVQELNKAKMIVMSRETPARTTILARLFKR